MLGLMAVAIAISPIAQGNQGNDHKYNLENILLKRININCL